ITTWMNACDLFVLPSLNEGNPTVLVEAFGTGTPYVGTNVGGIPEIVNSEKLGLLCDSGNSKALAQVVVQALKKEWNKSIINRYARQYTWENITNKIIKIHNRLIE
ncbi:MAG: glycosyltransferase, partial [Dehalococcoidales bacterium]|nr:glycosyltransferase [Dehalococcoidales bacterium]